MNHVSCYAQYMTNKQVDLSHLAVDTPLETTPEDIELQRQHIAHEEAEYADKIATYEKLVKKADEAAEQENCWPAVRGIDFFNRPRVPVQAYIPDFIYAGCLNATIGDAKVGKTTLEWAKVIAMLTGGVFLNRQCTPAKILYISEQSEVSFRHQLENSGHATWHQLILKHPNFYMMLPEDHKYKLRDEGSPMNAADWKTRMMAWTQAVKNVKPDVFILDTFAAYAGLGENGENDNAAINTRLFDLKQLRIIRPSLAIEILHHTAKTKGAGRFKYLDLSVCRGASAFAGALDHAVIVNKPSTKGTEIPRTRYIHIDGRMTLEKKIAINWQRDDGTYIEIPDTGDNFQNSGTGEDESYSGDDLSARIQALVDAEPGLTDCSIRRFVDALADRGLKVSYRQARKFLP